MTPLEHIEHALREAGFPVHDETATTIRYWLRQGKSVEFILREVFAVTPRCPECVAHESIR